MLTTAERQGDFSALCTAGFNAQGLCNNLAQQLYNPFSANTSAGRQPFLNNRINASPSATQRPSIVNSPLYPQPTNNNLTNNQNNLTHSFTNSDQGDVKIDWAATQKDHVYGRYSQQNITNPTINSLPLQGNSLSTYPLYNGVIDYSHTFSATLLNNFRLGASYFPVTFSNTNATGQNLPAVFGIAGAAPDVTLHSIPGIVLLCFQSVSGI